MTNAKMSFGAARTMVREALPALSNAERDWAVNCVVDGTPLAEVVAKWNAASAAAAREKQVARTTEAQAVADDAAAVASGPDVSEGENYVTQRQGERCYMSRYTVQFPGSELHVVHVECSLDGTPQNKRCDCKGFKFRGKCRHIDAVYAAGRLYATV